MKLSNFNIKNLIQALNVFALFTSIFRSDCSKNRLYKFAFASVIGLIVARLSYVGYRLYKYGYVREVEHVHNDDDEVANVSPEGMLD